MGRTPRLRLKMLTGPFLNMTKWFSHLLWPLATENEFDRRKVFRLIHCSFFLVSFSLHYLFTYSRFSVLELNHPFIFVFSPRDFLPYHILYFRICIFIYYVYFALFIENEQHKCIQINTIGSSKGLQSKQE